MFDQMHQRHFRCACDTMKHRFAREQTPNRYTIDAPHKHAFKPALDTVCVTCLMQFRVSLYELTGYPRFSPAGSRFSTAFNHGLERTVNRHFEWFPAQQTPDAPWDVKSIKFYDCARVR